MHALVWISVAAALVKSAHCPVAVIGRAGRLRATPEAGSIVVEANNAVVLRHAFEEARLRGVRLRAIASWPAESPDDIADGNRLAQGQLNRRIALWKRLYPDVEVEPIAVRGSVCRYLATNADSVQLFVADAGSFRCDLGRPGPVKCSVLTVGRKHL